MPSIHAARSSSNFEASFGYESPPVNGKEYSDMKNHPRARFAKFGAGLVPWAGAYAVLQRFSDFVTTHVLRLSPRSSLGASVDLFLYQAPKILMLLVLVIFGAGIVRSFFTPSRVRETLAGSSQLAGGVLAATLGTVTPYCSCSALPLFVGFVEAGIPLGMTLSFLVAAPLVNEIAVVLLVSMFGWKVAALYVATGLIIAITAGWIVSRLKMDRFIEPWVLESHSSRMASPNLPLMWEDRLRIGQASVGWTLRRIWPYLLVGVGAGAAIHGYMPAGFLTLFYGKQGMVERAVWRGPGRADVFQPGGCRAHNAGADGKRRIAGHGAGLYDGGDRNIAAGGHNPAQGPEAPTDRYLSRHNRCRDSARRLAV